jgi:lysophospholipase L1-like esterase
MSPGDFELGTAEFRVTGSINAQWMNDAPLSANNDDGDAAATRVLALGDSHTYAVGVSTVETWPKVLERDLAAAFPGRAFRTYNTGTPGYNLHQYLLRLIDQGPALRPQYVVVGFSYATDLYDLLPPDRGGWIYGTMTSPRDYFDLDDRGALVEKHWVPPAGGSAQNTARSSEVRRLLGRLATFRHLRRSRLALYLGSHLGTGSQSLWPNMEVVVEREIAPEHRYQWQLAEALLLRMKQESDRLGAKLVVVGIPYLPQVYDEVWNATFGGDPRYDRAAAEGRLSSFCAEHGIAYVGTLDALRKKTAEVGHWLHYRKDAHPTPEGQAVIAQAIAESGAIQPAQ